MVTKQASNTQFLILNIQKQIAFASKWYALHPGDIISTGCPKGARIKAGDRVRARIEGVGTTTANVTQGERIPFGFSA